MSGENSNNPQEEEPQLFSVKKSDNGGWQFSRREFIKGAGATATALSMGGILGGVAKAQDAEETPSPLPILGVQAHTSSVQSLAISVDGKLLASASSDATIKLWSLPDGGLIKTLEGHAGVVHAVAISTNGELIASGGEDKTVKLWSSTTGELLHSLESHSEDVFTVAFTPDGQLLISGSKNGTIKLWSLPDGTLLNTLQGFMGWITSLAVSSDGTFFASGGLENVIKLWSLPNGELLNIISTNGMVKSIVLSPDNHTLIGASSVVRIWDITDENEIVSGLLEENSGGVNSLAISSDGKQVVGGLQGSILVIWSLEDNTFLKFIDASLGTDTYGGYSIRSVVLSPDGNLLVSASSDNTIKLWSLPDGNYIKDLIDIAASLPDFEGALYSPNDEGSSVITLPCGSDIPAGSTCICNCVAGSGCSCVGNRGGGGGTHYWYPN